MRLLLISGFLGSGKTTLLLEIARRLAADGQKTAIIENEIGEVGIDGQYLRREGLEVQELFGGCVCCTLASDLVTTLTKLEQAYGPERVILEASGVARPGDIVPTVRQYSAIVDEVEVLAVMDAPRFEMLLEAMNPLVTSHIEAAGLVAINKIDASDEETVGRIERSIADLNSRARAFAISAEKRINLEALMSELV